MAQWYRVRIETVKGSHLIVRTFKNVDAICADSLCSVTFADVKAVLKDNKRYKWQVIAKKQNRTTPLKTPKSAFRTDFTPAPEPTATEDPNVDPLPYLIYFNDFIDGLASLGTLDPFWTVDDYKDDFALLVYDSNRRTRLHPNVAYHSSLSDVVVQFDYQTSLGALNVDTTYYSFTLTQQGDVTLYRGSTAPAVVQTAVIPGYDHTQWHQARFSVIGDQIAVRIDGQTILTFTDPEPLHGWEVGFKAQTPTTQYDDDILFVDNIRMWGSTPPDWLMDGISVSTTPYEMRENEFFIVGNQIYYEPGMFEADGNHSIFTPLPRTFPGSSKQLTSVGSGVLTRDGLQLAFTCSVLDGSTTQQDICVVGMDLESMTAKPETLANRTNNTATHPGLVGWTQDQSPAHLIYGEYDGSGGINYYQESPGGVRNVIATVPEIINVRWGKDDHLYGLYPHDGQFNVGATPICAEVNGIEECVPDCEYDNEGVLIACEPAENPDGGVYQMDNGYVRVAEPDLYPITLRYSGCEAVQTFLMSGVDVNAGGDIVLGRSGWLTAVQEGIEDCPEPPEYAHVDYRTELTFVRNGIYTSPVKGGLDVGGWVQWSPFEDDDLFMYSQGITGSGPKKICHANHNPINDCYSIPSFTSAPSWQRIIPPIIIPVDTPTPPTPVETPTEPPVCPASAGNWDTINAPPCQTDPTGLRGRYFNGFAVLETPAPQRRDPVINFPSEVTWPSQIDNINRFSAVWSGKVVIEPPSTPTPDVTPTATFTGTPTPTVTPTPTPIKYVDVSLFLSGQPINEDEGVRMWLDGILVIDHWGKSTAINEFSVSMDTIQVGSVHDVWIEYYNYNPVQNITTQPDLKLEWSAEEVTPPNPTPTPSITATPEGSPTLPPTPIAIARTVIPEERLLPIQPTETPAESMQDLAACRNNKAGVVPVFTGATQETLDMLAVLDYQSSSDVTLSDALVGEAIVGLNDIGRKPTGLRLHEAPMLNAKDLGIVIPWGAIVTVTNRMEFPSEDPGSQIWYRISDYQVGTSELESVDGWVAARIEEAYYFVGVSGGSDPCHTLGAPATLTFTYNRQAAANYAIKHSYNNNTTARSANRVTERIAGFWPYVEFIYSDLNPGGEIEATGSAQFVSEILWAGGMPMTTGEDGNCSLDWPAINFGWRYCEDVLTASKAWSVHKGIGMHFTTGNFPVPSGGSSNILTTGGTQLGYQIIFDGLDLTDRISPVEDWGEPSNIFRNLRLGGPQVGDNPGGLDKNKMGVFAEQHLDELEMGDYVWINPYFEGTPHGLIIVGWQEANFCRNVLSDNRNPSFTSATLYETRSQAAQFVTNPVPYVADYTTAQSPMPRPFYCTWYDQTSDQPDSPPPGQNTVLKFNEHWFHFYKMPDRIDLLAQQLYTNTNWVWGVPQ